MPTLIDPEQIYPKRMGLYRGALVIQYYYLQRDCFKKHLIPYDGTQNPNKIVQNILKNPKHAVFLRKVAPEHIKAVLSGRSYSNVLPVDITQNNISQQNERTNIYHPSSSNTNTYTSTQSYSNTSKPDSSSFNQNSSSNLNKKSNQFDHSGSFNASQSFNKNKEDKKKLKSQQNFQQSLGGYSMNFDEQELSVSVVKNKQTQKNQHIIQEQLEYYDEDFEKLSGAEDMQEQAPPPKQQPIKVEQKKLSKKKKQQQEVMDEFQFLDEQPKKKKKKKKDKSKSKDKKKQKQSKQGASKPQKQQAPIEEQFQFI